MTTGVGIADEDDEDEDSEEDDSLDEDTDDDEDVEDEEEEELSAHTTPSAELIVQLSKLTFIELLGACLKRKRTTISEVSLLTNTLPAVFPFHSHCDPLQIKHLI